jgi:tetratricopeptide (TPR) repeat protein
MNKEMTENTEVKDEQREDPSQELARANYEKGKSAVYNKQWDLAIEFFEEAMRLASEDDVPFLERIKKQMDKAKSKSLDHDMYLSINSLVEQGNDFKEMGSYAEAILEYEEAYRIVANLPEDHKYVVLLKRLLVDCRRSVVRPYLAKIYRAYHRKKFSSAANLMGKAMNLIDKKDEVYKKLLTDIQGRILEHVDEKEVQESFELENSAQWEKAVKEYEEALDLYSSFTIVDPFAPAYANANVYEDKFIESRRKLGKLYKGRADKYRDGDKIEKAIKNYKEALKLLPKADKLFHETFKEIKKLRAKLAI